LNDTIKLYRIVKTKLQSKALDGEGARLYGGRWNSKGKSCVYCASSQSLAQLEMLVHMQSTALFEYYSIFELSISHAQVTSIDAYPDNWQDEPAPSSTARIGDQWLVEGKTVSLEIPSVIVPEESNFLLNPLHDDFNSIVNSAVSRPLKFDERLKQ
jgi:RES domain-containing protein